MTDNQHPGARPGPDDRYGRSVVPPVVWIDDSDEDDPLLRNSDGSLVDTWREEYPYTEREKHQWYFQRQWKLSPTDIALLDKWDDYTVAKVAMFQRTRLAARAVDGDQEQRQEAGAGGGHAQPAGRDRLRG
jgi:Polyphosphate kinase 2 (PPK2)